MKRVVASLTLAILVFSVAVAAAPSATKRHSSATAGRCSKAAAREIVEQLGLGERSAPAPVGRVLCGSFTGPGSETMVVSLWGPGNTGFVEWAVFRWAGGTWQFLMKQPAAAAITAAGPDIRQTLPIYRPSDSRCCPSGGTKSRLWRWNGSRFVAGAWHITRAKADQPTRFESPSGNIECSLYDGSSSRFSRGVVCSTETPPQYVTLTADGRLKIRKVSSTCGCDEPDAPRLAYGKQITVGRFRCVSQETGVTCTVIQSGKGFLINRDGISRIGS
jgi:hypothetical protein